MASLAYNRPMIAPARACTSDAGCAFAQPQRVAACAPALRLPPHAES
jgi:hypothetical protein